MSESGRCGGRSSVGILVQNKHKTESQLATCKNKSRKIVGTVITLFLSFWILLPSVSFGFTSTATLTSRAPEAQYVNLLGFQDYFTTTIVLTEDTEFPNSGLNKAVFTVTLNTDVFNVEVDGRGIALYAASLNANLFNSTAPNAPLVTVTNAEIVAPQSTPFNWDVTITNKMNGQNIDGFGRFQLELEDTNDPANPSLQFVMRGIPGNIQDANTLLTQNAKLSRQVVHAKFSEVKDKNGVFTTIAGDSAKFDSNVADPGPAVVPELPAGFIGILGFLMSGVILWLRRKVINLNRTPSPGRG